jgi:hypothetical protein
MLFVFRPEHMLGLAKGTLKVVSSKGVPLSIVRDAATGRIVGHAVACVSQPLVAAVDLVIGGAKMLQTHVEFQETNRIINEGFQETNSMINAGFQETYKRLDFVQSGLQSLQNSVGVLQATTALIGLGTVTGVVLSAVNLHHTLKLRQDVKQLRLEVKDGFIDMKQALTGQGAEIIKRIDQVAQDVKFEMHRLALIKAYGRFREATKLIKTGLLIEDLSTRNITLGNAQILLANALADYNEPHLLEATCAAGHLRRVECAWAIEQTMALTFQLQNAPAAVSDRLSHLQDKIRQDSLTVIDRCESEEELDFLFPELTRIHSHDLAVLESWQHHVDWIQTLSPDERKMLASSDIPAADSSNINEELAVVAQPEEQVLYESLKEKSHYLSLRDQLKFMIKPDLRRGHESYISQEAPASGLKALAPSNWQAVPDLTVANLYWYFKDKEAQARKSG